MAEFQTLQVPFVKGLDTRTHPYLVDPPGLTLCQNAQFDKVGLSFRYPYAAFGANIVGGGTLSGVRKLAVAGDELLAFTATTVYTWIAALSAWSSLGTHLAVATAETAVFGNTTDQVFADRAQLGNVVAYVWTEVASSSSSTCYLAARDLTTGAVVLAPTAFPAGSSRPRVIATDTLIWVLYLEAGGIYYGGFPPSVPAMPAFTQLSASGIVYDAVRHPTLDLLLVVERYASGLSYTFYSIDNASVKTGTNKVRAATGCIALAPAPTAVDRVQIVRQDGTNIVGDLLVLSTQADVFTGQAIGASSASTISQLTGAFRSVTTGGFYRCYVFWSVAEGDATNDLASSGIQMNYTDTNNSSIPGQRTLIYRNGLASRAFDYAGSVYVWTVFAAANNDASGAAHATLGFEVPVQSSCYLHRDDATFHAKAVWSKAGGYGYYEGHLAGVALVSGSTGYAWATTTRNFIQLGGYFNTAGYGDRNPQDVLFTFDSDSARRVVQLGRTAYVSGGILQQYDGEGLTEVGFEQFPWFIKTTASAAGAMAAGVYSYKESLRWVNARGETERSTTAIGVAQTVAANRKVTWWASRLRVTKKLSTRRAPSIEMWRQVVNAPPDAPWYLITDRDPSTTTPNNYVANDPAAVLAVDDQTDNMTDAVLTTNEQHPENGAVLPRFAPPPATILAVTDTRMLLAGVPGDPYGVWYSLARNEGEIVGFHPALRFTLPASTGPVTAVAVIDKTPVVWTAGATYVVMGDGLDNLGGGANYEPRLVPQGLGIGCASQDTVAVTPVGAFFFGRRGWYRLSSGWELEYIGARVESFNTDSWIAAQVVPLQHQIRVLSASRMLVFDWLAGEWSEWTETAGVSLAVWGTTALMVDSVVKAQATTLTSITYSLDVETGWFKPSGPQGRNRVRWLEVLGELKVAHSRRVRVGVNYVASAYTDDKTIAITGTAGDPAQTRLGPRVQQVESMRVRVTVAAGTGNLDNVVLTGLSLDIAPKKGVHRGNPTWNQ